MARVEDCAVDCESAGNVSGCGCPAVWISVCAVVARGEICGSAEEAAGVSWLPAAGVERPFCCCALLSRLPPLPSTLPGDLQFNTTREDCNVAHKKCTKCEPAVCLDVGRKIHGGKSRKLESANLNSSDP